MSRKAIQVTTQGSASLVSDAPLLRLRDDHIVAKTKSVALNPTDHHHHGGEEHGHGHESQH